MPAKQASLTPGQDPISFGRARESPATAVRRVQAICRITGNLANYFANPYLTGVVHLLLEAKELLHLAHHVGEGVIEEGH